MDFYTNISSSGSKILYRGITNGKQVIERTDFKPVLFLLSKDKETEYKGIHGEPMDKLEFSCLKEARDFVKSYEEVQNFEIHGSQRFPYAYLNERFPSEVPWDSKYINVGIIDIEVASADGFPNIETANQEITAISLATNNRFVTLACGDFQDQYDFIKYIKCKDEVELLERFLDIWVEEALDVISGWNIQWFDIPYLVNRIIKLFGEKSALKLSPWKSVRKKTEMVRGRLQSKYVLLGIATLDYFDLYRKFAPKGETKESYKLDFIANEELGEGKLSYDEYGTLHLLYLNDFQRFISYNQVDCILIQKLDKKLKLFDLVFNIAYMSKTNYEDVFAQVRMWDVMITNKLLKEKVVVPPMKVSEKDYSYVGAYVKDPKLGLHKWIASFDATSLYPNLIIQFNISPETFVEPEDYPPEIKWLVSKNSISVESMLEKKIDTSILKKYNLTMTPNGQFFRTTKRGFLAEMMDELQKGRRFNKDKMIEAEKELEEVKKLANDSPLIPDIEAKIAKYKGLQNALKTNLNSCYGAIGSGFFRHYDIRQAAAITTAGQYVIQTAEKEVNKYLNKLLSTEDRDYCVASDTDSLFICFDELVCQTFGKKIENPRKVIDFLDRVCKVKIQPFLDKVFAEVIGYTNAIEQRMFMKRETLSDKGIWTAKKRYVLNVWYSEGVRHNEPEMKVVGLEIVRSSTPTSCKKKLKEALKIVLNEDNDSIIKFIKEYREEFTKLELNDISFPRTVNGISKYSTVSGDILNKCPVHVRGSVIYNNLVKKMELEKKYRLLKEGEKIKFVYLKTPNILFCSNIISFFDQIPEEFHLEKYIDYETQFEKAFLGPLKNILDVIGWKTEKTQSVLDFFS